MKNSEVIDEIDWLLSVIKPGSARKIDQKLALERIGINVFQRSIDVINDLHAKRSELIDVSAK